MADSFDIELTTRLKINRLGTELNYVAGFFFLLLWIVLLPTQYLPSEIAFLYIILVIPRKFVIVIGISILLVIIGEWLRGMRSVVKGKLRIYPDKMTIETSSGKRDIPYDEIHKFLGTMNLHSYHTLTYTILLKDKTKIEVRTSKEIYEELTDRFPDKV